MITNSNILITGGTGSFGNRVAQKIIAMNPKSVSILSRDEKKQYEMKKLFPDFRYLIGDVRDANRVDFCCKNMDYIFHAAALKQVPNCEDFPHEALQTNSIGSFNVCNAAIRNNVKKVVFLSTDKAVKPINAMGISKAMMEKIVVSQNNKNINDCATIFCCVRYGNVMASRGSVIPFFRKCIESGSDIPITVPEMTRFMLTLDDACELVFYAFENSKGGEIFVKKSPACTVDFLVDFMLKYHGGSSQKKIIGPRPGEKYHETLINEYESLRASDMGDFFIINPEYSSYFNSSIEFGIEYTSENTNRIINYDDFLGLYKRANFFDLE